MEILRQRESTFTPNSLRPRRHPPRSRRVPPPRLHLLHLALLEGGYQRLLSGQRALRRGIVGMFRPLIDATPCALQQRRLSGSR
jgi:hypothetical protein